VIKIVMHCDIPDCGSYFETRVEPTMVDARTRASERFGWTHKGDRDICADHTSPAEGGSTR
jgi:hypothetical protein